MLRGVEPTVVLPGPTLRYLKRRDEKKEYFQAHQKERTTKARRTQKQNDQIASEWKKITADKKAGVTYESGVAVQQVEKRPNQKKPCKCGSYEHSRTNHRSCPQNAQNLANKATQPSRNLVREEQSPSRNPAEEPSST